LGFFPQEQFSTWVFWNFRQSANFHGPLRTWPTHSHEMGWSGLHPNKFCVFHAELAQYIVRPKAEILDETFFI
jgi:hypothetical protein